MSFDLKVLKAAMWQNIGLIESFINHHILEIISKRGFSIFFFLGGVCGGSWKLNAMVTKAMLLLSLQRKIIRVKSRYSFVESEYGKLMV